jgi:hypothetical protein
MTPFSELVASLGSMGLRGALILFAFLVGGTVVSAGKEKGRLT